MKDINVAIIGCQFMGKAHSNAWANVNHFFDIPFKPVLKVACDLNEKASSEIAAKWGWQETETDWKKVVERDDVDVVVITTPPLIHRDIAVAAGQDPGQ